MEAAGEPQESPPSPAHRAAPAAGEDLANSASAQEHAGEPADPNTNGPSEGEAAAAEAVVEDRAVDEEGTDALTVAGHAASPRAVIGDRSDRLSKQYLQRTSELRGQYRAGLV